MNFIISNWKEVPDNGLKALLILLPATFPFSRRLSIIISLLILVVLMISKGPVFFIKELRNTYVLLFLSLFVLSTISLIYSDHISFFPLEKKASLLLFPIVFNSISFNEKEIRYLLASFVFGISIMVGYATIFTYNNRFAYDTEMTLNALDISHVYSSIYIVFSLVCIAYFLFNSTSIIHRIILIIVFLAQLLFLFFLGGKMAIISLIILSFIGVMYFFFSNRDSKKIRVVVLLIPFIVFVLSLYKVDIIKSRFSYLFNKEHYFVGDNAWSSIGVRFTILACVKEVYTANPIFGTGLGDVQQDLDKCYEDDGYLTVKGMNAHNQYIEILLGLGLIGLFLFLSIFYISFKASIIYRNYLLFALNLIFALCCLTESLIERQQGLMFFTFFNSLLYFNHKTKTIDLHKDLLKNNDLDKNNIFIASIKSE